MIGHYENFPQNIHRTEIFTSPLSKKKLQQKIFECFLKINCGTFSFEEVGNPTSPNSTVIFEFGFADGRNFNFLNDEEEARLQKALDSEQLHILDWFCAIRYYKNIDGKRKPLKFDYYMLRMDFVEKSTVEFSIFHERGPRYISPEDLVNFIERRLNQVTSRKTLKRSDH